jgi:hypothetical protein
MDLGFYRGATLYAALAIFKSMVFSSKASDSSDLLALYAGRE